jgi:hypothetical protein
MQLALDGLDRLVDALEEQGVLSAVEAARLLFATSSIPEALACSLLEEVTIGDNRVVCTGATVSLAGKRADPLLEEAEFVVFDLETTGLSAARDEICEVGAVRVRALESVGSFQSLVNPRIPLPEHVARLTGLREEELRGAATVGSVVRQFLASPATTCSWRTTPGSISASSSSSCTVGASPSLRSARPRSRAACSRAGSAASAWLRSLTSSAFRPSRVTVRFRTQRRRLRCSCT